MEEWLWAVTFVLGNIIIQIGLVNMMLVSKRLDGKLGAVVHFYFEGHSKPWIYGHRLWSQGVPGRRSNNAAVDDRAEPTASLGGHAKLFQSDVNKGGF